MTKYWCQMPNDNEFQTMESIVAVSEPLYTFTDALSGEKCVIISTIHPLLKYILEKLLVSSPIDSCFVRRLYQRALMTRVGYIVSLVQCILFKCVRKNWNCLS